MRPKTEQGRREFAAIIGTAIVIQVLVGAVASLRSDSMAWGSLVHRPLLLGVLAIAAVATKRMGHLLLTAWFSFLALMYVYGGFAAGYAMLMYLRWIAAGVFGWGAVRLATSVHIRAYLEERRLDRPA